MSILHNRWMQIMNSENPRGVSDTNEKKNHFLSKMVHLPILLSNI